MTPAVTAAKRTGIEFEVLEYDASDAAEAWGTGAARALGIAPERVFKTLVVDVAGASLAVAIVPVAARLDLRAVAAALGAKRAAMAETAAAEARHRLRARRDQPVGPAQQPACLRHRRERTRVRANSRERRPTGPRDRARSRQSRYAGGGRRRADCALNRDQQRQDKVLKRLSGPNVPPGARPRGSLADQSLIAPLADAPTTALDARERPRIDWRARPDHGHTARWV